MNPEDSNLKESDFLRLLWDYFSMHGAQRMQMLNFYIALETFFITALLALFQLEKKLMPFRLVLSIAVIFFSFVFYALDTRTKRMVKLSEDAIKYVERKYEGKYGKETMIFSAEMKKTLQERNVSGFAKRCLSYTKLFRLVFMFFVLIGILGVFMEICNICA